MAKRKCECDTCEVLRGLKRNSRPFLVYRYKLKKSALKDRNFIKANKGVKRTKQTLYYVGSTWHRLEHRLAQHFDPKHSGGRNWGTKYMKKGSGELIKDYGTLDTKFGKGKEPYEKKREWVEAREKYWANQLRKKGYWVIQN